jgi:hypothetical protein
MAERTAAIGIKTIDDASATSTLYQSVNIQELRDNLNAANIKFAKNRLTMTMTVINVKYSDFDNASKIITDTGFEILN